MRGVAVPVLESALDRSLQLATSMDAARYGRRIARRHGIPPVGQWGHDRRVVAGGGRALRGHRLGFALRSWPAHPGRRGRPVRYGPGPGRAALGSLAVSPRPVAAARMDGGRLRGWRCRGDVGRPMRSMCRDSPFRSHLWPSRASRCSRSSGSSLRWCPALAAPQPISSPPGQSVGDPAAARPGCRSRVVIRPHLNLISREHGMISFDQVSFTYTDAARPTLHQVTLEIPEGELCVVVGETGDGQVDPAARPSTASSRTSAAGPAGRHRHGGRADDQGQPSA